MLAIWAVGMGAYIWRRRHDDIEGMELIFGGIMIACALSLVKAILAD